MERLLASSESSEFYFFQADSASISNNIIEYTGKKQPVVLFLLINGNVMQLEKIG
jgi:hypothetical protein